MNGIGKIICVAALLAFLAACAAGSPDAQHAASAGALSQFVLGLWHGIIAPVTLLIEIFNRLAPKTLPWAFRMYEGGNTGVAYDVGFYLGLAGGPLFGWRRWSRRRVRP